MRRPSLAKLHTGDKCRTWWEKPVQVYVSNKVKCKQRLGNNSKSHVTMCVCVLCMPELSPQWFPRWSLYSLQPARCSRLGQGCPLLLCCCSMRRTRTRTEGLHGFAQPLQKLQSLMAQSCAAMLPTTLVEKHYRTCSVVANNQTQMLDPTLAKSEKQWKLTKILQTV